MPPSGGWATVSPSSGDLERVVREIVGRLELAITGQGASMSLRVEGPLGEVVFDRDALAQILANLIDNAEKYSRGTDERTIQVEIAAASDREGSGARVTVIDRGPGVAPALKRRLFDAFARGVAEDQPAGLGLGLALTRALAEAQGGRIEYCDAEGGGASFTLHLPGPR